MASLKERVYFWKRKPDEDVIRKKLETRAIKLACELPKTDWCTGLVFIKREMVPLRFLDSFSINGLGRLRVELKMEEEGSVTASIRTRQAEASASIESDQDLFEKIIEIGERAVRE